MSSSTPLSTNLPPPPTLGGYSKARLDKVVHAIASTLADPQMRALSQRAVQGKVWHLQPAVSAMLSDLRGEEEQVRRSLLDRTSALVYKFHEQGLDATLARAGLTQDARVHAGSSLDQKETFDLFCLDAKERLYMTLKNYDWLKDFFRLYPLHFYENSFQFVDRIPTKKLKVKVKVVGLGIGGSVAVSGLAKSGIETVVGYEKRGEKGPRSVSSRYQNASWRAYDIAGKLVDEEAFQHLIENRQRINVKYDDGTEAIVSSDRVQIIIGSAIQSAIDSARRYGAELHFESPMDAFYSETKAKSSPAFDIVALFCGAHTSQMVPGMAKAMEVHEWPDLNSTCKMWLRVMPSDKLDSYCARGGEIGAEQWHYTIESARQNVEDMERIGYNLDSQYQYNLGKLAKGADIGMTKEQVEETYQQQKARLAEVMEIVKSGKSPGNRFDYVFTNAPHNEHNVAKHAAVKEQVVLDGGYTVEIKIASKSIVKDEELLDKFNTSLIVCGGDACVPPNPLAAYGATLACEAAGNLVQLAVGVGHLNSILEDMEAMQENVPEISYDWIQEVKDLKSLLIMYYEARSRSENYFQWVQTLICNMYSLPPKA
jgi:hypothetical protein